MLRKLENSLRESANLMLEFCNSTHNLACLLNLSEKMAQSFRNGNKILICGNGGSACDAMHFAEEFTGRYRQDRPALPVIHLGDSGHITCVANDYGYEHVFARGVEAYGRPGDWLIGLSTSGNSKNVIRAFQKAQKLQLETFALLGKDGGQLKGLADHEYIIPGQTADRIQEVHMALLHVLIEGIERILFPENYLESINSSSAEVVI